MAPVHDRLQPALLDRLTDDEPGADTRHDARRVDVLDAHEPTGAARACVEITTYGGQQ